MKASIGRPPLVEKGSNKEAPIGNKGVLIKVSFLPFRNEIQAREHVQAQKRKRESKPIIFHGSPIVGLPWGGVLTGHERRGGEQNSWQPLINGRPHNVKVDPYWS